MKGDSLLIFAAGIKQTIPDYAIRDRQDAKTDHRGSFMQPISGMSHADPFTNCNIARYRFPVVARVILLAMLRVNGGQRKKLSCRRGSGKPGIDIAPDLRPDTYARRSQIW